MDKNYTQFTMRIDNEVYQHVKESAERNKRSIAKEIEYILEEWCRPPQCVAVSPKMQDAIKNFVTALKKEGHINIDI